MLNAMATLHLINKSPARSDSLSACLRACAAEDRILLLEDGVYAALTGSDTAAALADVAVALEADVQARGLGGRLAAGVPCIDDAAFVDLCVRCDRVMSWF